MITKKNPELEVGRNSSLYFAVGLCVMLAFTNLFLNHKTYDKDDFAMDLIVMDEEFDDEIPITEQIQTPPPPPPQATPEVITVIDDIEEIEETVIESTETNQDEGIEEREVFVEDVEVEEVEEYVEVPFSVIENVPIFPGCKGNNNELKKCFQEKMAKHLVDNFEYPEVAMEMGIHGKVFVLFVIDSNGKVSNIRTRGPDKILEKEAARIISLLPQMVPGKQRGRSVNVPYSIPINFTLMN